LSAMGRQDLWFMCFCQQTFDKSACAAFALFRFRVRFEHDSRSIRQPQLGGQGFHRGAGGCAKALSDAIPGHLLRNHSDRRQPRLHQLRPSGYRKLRASQTKRMAALRIQMHLHGNAGVLQSNVVSERVVYVIHMVILSLQQKRRPMQRFRKDLF